MGIATDSLDYEFLRYIGVTPESQRRIQSFYLPFFDGCQRVLDLGCGDGDFLTLLEDKGIEGVGVDRDQRCCQAASERGLKVVCQDVFAYLKEQEEASFDGIFSSHLVEHLPYEAVLELFSLCHRNLKKGGTLVVTTPNVRGLFSHLEMFYMHFGHVTFYHPNLLCFFLKRTGFQDVTMGENPSLAYPLLGDIGVSPLEMSGTGQTRGPWWTRPFRGLLLRLLGPELRSMTSQVNRNLEQLRRALERVDRSFECYAKGEKG